MAQIVRIGEGMWRDIDGDTRSGTCDIGADEYVAAGRISLYGDLNGLEGMGQQHWNPLE